MVLLTSKRLQKELSSSGVSGLGVTTVPLSGESKETPHASGPGVRAVVAAVYFGVSYGFLDFLKVPRAIGRGMCDHHHYPQAFKWGSS